MAITKMQRIPITSESKPFAAAAEKCGFDALQYVEEEYFQTGTANVYAENALHEVSPIFRDAPYTTRVIVRRPKDKAHFSGNVVLEILNSSANIDIDRMWVNSWPFFTRNGDIYVGISSKGHVVDSLKGFDPRRYAPINWDNPIPDRPAPEMPKDSKLRFLPQYEMGLFWDMLVDLAKLLRSGDEKNFLREFGVPYLYLTGWSQSTAYVNRVVRSFAYRPENCGQRPLFDGYLNGGGGANLCPVNNDVMFSLGGIDPAGGVMGAREPFIAVNTESENCSSFWYGDFDEPNFKFRTWQIAGSSHDSKYNLVDYYGEADLKMLEGLGIYNGYYGVDGEALNCPYEPVFSAAFQALYKWTRDKIPAPHAPKIETYMSTEPVTAIRTGYVGNLTDAFGNCRGGIRIPAIAYPTGKYSPTSTKADGTVMGAFGKVNPFSGAMLRELYGSLAHYRTLIEAEYDRLAAQGFLLEGDRKANLDYTEACAKARGLE